MTSHNSARWFSWLKFYRDSIDTLKHYVCPSCRSLPFNTSVLICICMHINAMCIPYATTKMVEENSQHFIKSSNVTQSDKTSLIARKYTYVYNYIYLLFCVCYSNSVSFIELLRSFCIHGETCAKILCSEKELLNLKDSKLTQNFYGNIRLVLSDRVTNV